MKRGPVRARSSSTGSEADEARPRQRLRQSAATSSTSYTDDHQVSLLLSPSTPLASPPSRHMNTMGPPLHHTNGSSLAGDGAITNNRSGEPGPSTGRQIPDHISAIQPVRLEGNLMYEDDRDWSEQPSYTDNATDQHTDDGHQEDELDERTFFKRQGADRPGVGGRKRMPIEREEAVRIMLQGLRDIGYHQAAEALEAESGYHLSSQSVTDFQAAILGGRWSEACTLLTELGIPITNPSEPESSGSSMASGKTKATMAGRGTGSVADQAKFLIAQQKYLEYLESGNQKRALAVLRGEVRPVARDSDVLHTLSGFMMCMDKDDLYERASWDGAAGSSRRYLLEHLQTFISPTIMLPPRRLATLFDQARRHQQMSCVYHEDPDASSLYVDHKCEVGQFPSVTTHILADHTDEVWRIEWSPDGLSLASAGMDKSVVIWQLKATPKKSGGTQYSVSPSFHLKDHTDPVDAMAWSPDGKTLVTGAGQAVYVWNTKTGALKPRPQASSQHGDTISSIQWLPDGSEFVVASMDCKVVFYGPSGNMLRQWSTFPLQLGDFVITPDGKRIVAITTPLKRVSHNDRLKQSMSARPSEETETLGPALTNHAAAAAAAVGAGGSGGAAGPGAQQPFQYATMEHQITIIRILDHEIIDWSQDLRCETTSIKISSDGRRILVSCTPDEVQVWSIDPGLRYLRKHAGHVQGHYLIRSCFGAPKDRFVLSGSEDGHVYVWQGNNINPVEVLSGHRNVVNAVAWNPVASRRIFASCSDDHTVRIWQPPINVNEDQSTLDLNITGLNDGDGDGVPGEGEAETRVESEVGEGEEVDSDDEGMVL